MPACAHGRWEQGVESGRASPMRHGQPGPISSSLLCGCVPIDRAIDTIFTPHTPQAFKSLETGRMTHRTCQNERAAQS